MDCNSILNYAMVFCLTWNGNRNILTDVDRPPSDYLERTPVPAGGDPELEHGKIYQKQGLEIEIT